MSFAAYLVGTFEKRLGIVTQFQVVNATAKEIELHAIYLDRNGHVLYCEKAEIGANALWERDTAKLVEKVGPEAGVAKFFSLRDGELTEAIVGFQRRVAAGPFGAISFAVFGESNLADVPLEVGVEDYKKVSSHCP